MEANILINDIDFQHYYMKFHNLCSSIIELNFENINKGLLILSSMFSLATCQLGKLIYQHNDCKLSESVFACLIWNLRLATLDLQT